MKDFNLLRSKFVRQSGQNDCGTACMAMILNYIGRTKDSAIMLAETLVPETGLSLLDLRKLAGTLGINARCVAMDLATLRSIEKPVILHTVTDGRGNHFVVCYGSIQQQHTWYYIIGDPAQQMTVIPENEFEIIWQSNAALYFEDIVFRSTDLRDQAWISLFSIKVFPTALWVAIPFLNICATFLGIALSWVLQQGINDSLAEKKKSLIIAVLLLLLVIILFKSVVSYIKQHVLIKLSNEVNEQFINSFIQKIFSRRGNANLIINERTLKSSMLEVQKIQSAVSNFAAVMLSEGSLIIFILTGLFYAQPLIGLINALYIIILIVIALKNASFLSCNTAYLNILSETTERNLLKDLQDKSGFERNEKHLKLHLQNHSRYLSQARTIATRISRTNLLYECIGAVSVLIVFASCLEKLKQMEMSYTVLMALVIASYFITTLTPRICNVFVVIIEGAEASRLSIASTTLD
ncbi:cysteine peptidase family C39 domain-containing protein [Mucilaginibacter sp. RCC_168]|uniref:cysteine peptidase family C39 domain-containing protein n=1 Tax=Mucilaginibacter sp. RCC_168 TaxID=3239221 RepID=UPI0035267574